jgi:hypothetical protein
MGRKSYPLPQILGRYPLQVPDQSSIFYPYCLYFQHLLQFNTGAEGRGSADAEHGIYSIDLR